MNHKREILKVIYTAFDEWSAKQSRACRKGCATCCTQNVNITAVEGEMVLDYLIEKDMAGFAASALAGKRNHPKPKQTVNEFAADCFAGKDSDSEEDGSRDVCPFLHDDLCTVYSARPFGCRCFLSQQICTRTRPALVTNEYLTACTVISQLIEHLGQGEYYGNMLDVLPSMLDISRYHKIAEQLQDKTIPHTARTRILTAKPLPGFLLPPEDAACVTPLIDKIFKTRVDGKTIEDILNGK